MSDPAVEETEVSPQEGPGARLKKLREAQQLDLARVASQLHLNQGTLQALEADDYEKLPGPVFVQGYLRNYARLLNIPVGPVLESYQQLCPHERESSDLKMKHIREEVRSSHLGMRLVTWGVFTALVILFFIWWRGYLQWPLQVKTEAPAPAVEVTGDSPQPESQAERPGSLLQTLEESDATAEAVEAGENAIALPPLPQPQAAPEPEQEPEQADSQDPVEPAADPATTEAASAATGATTEAAVEQPAEASPQAAVLPEIRIMFDGPCWVEIRDSSGTFRVFGERRAGSSLKLEGKAPYNILLGNAVAARMTVDGEAFDLSPYTRNNVVRFVLELGE